jgi:hypothetical protein
MDGPMTYPGGKPAHHHGARPCPNRPKKHHAPPTRHSCSGWRRPPSKHAKPPGRTRRRSPMCCASAPRRSGASRRPSTGRATPNGCWPLTRLWPGSRTAGTCTNARCSYGVNKDPPRHSTTGRTTNQTRLIHEVEGRRADSRIFRRGQGGYRHRVRLKLNGELVESLPPLMV